MLRHGVLHGAVTESDAFGLAVTRRRQMVKAGLAEIAGQLRLLHYEPTVPRGLCIK